MGMIISCCRSDEFADLADLVTDEFFGNNPNIASLRDAMQNNPIVQSIASRLKSVLERMIREKVTAKALALLRKHRAMAAEGMTAEDDDDYDELPPWGRDEGAVATPGFVHGAADVSVPLPSSTAKRLQKDDTGIVKEALEEIVLPDIFGEMFAAWNDNNETVIVSSLDSGAMGEVHKKGLDVYLRNGSISVSVYLSVRQQLVE
jgi:hypothetical protein